MPQTGILIVGVGGQGTLLASRLIGSVALIKGYDVKVSEVHGMSQRGGSVITYIKYCDGTVSSPIIDSGEADFILAFEMLEALRNVHYLKKGGRLLINTQKINPMPVITGAAVYPDDIIKTLFYEGANILAADALEAAKNAGSEKAVNTVLIGLLAKNLGIERAVWDKAITDTIPDKFLAVNQRAFDLGYNL